MNNNRNITKPVPQEYRIYINRFGWPESFKNHATNINSSNAKVIEKTIVIAIIWSLYFAMIFHII